HRTVDKESAQVKVLNTLPRAGKKSAERGARDGFARVGCLVIAHPPPLSQVGYLHGKQQNEHCIAVVFLTERDSQGISGVPDIHFKIAVPAGQGRSLKRRPVASGSEVNRLIWAAVCYISPDPSPAV